MAEAIRHGEKLQAIGTLAGGIAHDFNNILTAINGYTGLALQHTTEDTPQRGHLEEVLTAGKRAKELIQQILAFSRQTTPEYKPCSLQKCVQEAIRFLQATLPATIEIRQDLEAVHSMIFGDPTQIHQVIMNLSMNAVQAMQHTGGLLTLLLEQIEITPGMPGSLHTLTPGPFIKLTVDDTGQGMTREVLDRLFDPFFTTKPIGEGTGMGLAVVHGLVGDHGGAITVESQPSAGTTFCVYFPHIQEREEPLGPREDPLPQGHERVLFVEDEAALCHLGQETLGQLGYEVTARTSSIEALEAFRQAPQWFHLVITDYAMPNMNGIELARELIHIRPDIPIVLCTGFSHGLTETQVKAVGIRDCLVKPMTIRELAETVRHVLDEGV